ncbi:MULTISPECIES: DUF4383 domain-containing protein [Nocardiopsis]|uniref:DUF4383 domain-containing protein n=1 Tax=Nocardiopsis lambiniae TaxID=3075539 RepID=A0ABU2MFL4_9ACTN|nr:MULTISPECIES: DUF4383 domain-containing protein [unclassified Nocardiopsis]MDE3721294.1 DUF4383 domain-containing protein [Nocardiopsis sp. N85]MDT0330666.1 DUF4383 domain-containing protein [Nocardiopsis sp. DSM 44743]
MDLDTTRSADPRLAIVHRIGAGLLGLVLVGFGVTSLFVRLPLFDTRGEVVAGLTTNGALGFLSVAIGSLLLCAMVVGGTYSSTVSVLVGAGFIVSGLVNLFLMDTANNILAFSMPNVIFSLVVGIALLTVGMYGRFTGGLPHDNPYRLYRERRRDRRLSGAAR